MRLCIVPMKPLARAKERLGPVLSADDRRRLSLAMLADVCAAAAGFERVWVLNSDADAAEVARAAGAEPRPDPTPDGGLNASLAEATVEAVATGATGILIVSADVPAATPDDLAAVSADVGIGLAPDRTGTGTNALWRSPGDAIPVAYGAGSRAAHEHLARTRGVSFHLVERDALAVDVDRPQDLGAVAAGAGPYTRGVLRALGLA